MPATTTWMQQLLDRLDNEAVDVMYRGISVRSAQVQARLRLEGLAHIHPGEPTPHRDSLQMTCERLTRQAASSGAFIGGLGGVAGALSIPAEVVGFVIEAIRLGQRFLVVYGVDPHSDRGHLYLLRALAVGFDIELPKQGLRGLRVSDLAQSVWAKQQGRVPQLGGVVVSTMMVTTGSLMSRQLRRFLPIVGIGASGASHFDGLTRIGTLMAAEVERLVLERRGGLVMIEDAIEVE